MEDRKASYCVDEGDKGKKPQRDYGEYFGGCNKKRSVRGD